MILTHGQIGGTEDNIYFLITEIPAKYEQKWMSALKESQARLAVLTTLPQVTSDQEGVSFTNDVLKMRAEYQDQLAIFNAIPQRETAIVVSLDGDIEMNGYKILSKTIGEQGRQFAKAQFKVSQSRPIGQGRYLIRIDENINLLGWGFTPKPLSAP